MGLITQDFSVDSRKALGPEMVKCLNSGMETRVTFGTWVVCILLLGQLGPSEQWSEKPEDRLWPLCLSTSAITYTNKKWHF